MAGKKGELAFLDPRESCITNAGNKPKESNRWPFEV